MYKLLICLLAMTSCQSVLMIHLEDGEKNRSQFIRKDKTSYEKRIDCLRDSIKMGGLPDFLLDECWLCNCFIPMGVSEGRIECFQSMLDSLDIDEISQLAGSGDSDRLKIACKDSQNCRYREDLNKSRWEIIQLTFLKKRRINGLTDQYLIPLMNNQPLIDTAAWFVNIVKFSGRHKFYTFLKFHSDGTYSKYSRMEGLLGIPASPIEKIGEGRYAVDTLKKEVTLEAISYSLDTDTYTRVIDKFHLSSTHTDLCLTTQNSESTIPYKVVFKKFKHIVFK